MMKYFSDSAALALATLLPNQTVVTDGGSTAGDQLGAVYYVTLPQGTGANDITLANGNIAVYQGSFDDAIKKEPGYDDIQDIINDAVSQTANSNWPIGSVFTYTIDNTNPNAILGFGTWERYGNGRVIVSQTGTDSDFTNPNQEGGAKTVAITEAQMPAHTHGVDVECDFIYKGNSVWIESGDSYNLLNLKHFTTDSRGDNAPHPNVQPYIVAYMWVRIA